MPKIRKSYWETIPNRLDEIRQSLGLNKSCFGEVCGMRLDLIRTILEQRTTPYIDKASKIAIALEKEVEDIWENPHIIPKLRNPNYLPQAYDLCRVGYGYLYSILKHQNISPEEIATHLNVSSDMVYLWCVGGSRMHLINAFTLGSLLNIPIRYIWNEYPDTVKLNYASGKYYVSGL